MVLRVVVLGTGTGVGKTWLTGALARAAPAGTCLALKPIESGWQPGTAADARQLRHASGIGPALPLYALRDPVTPMLAAERDGVVIDLAKVQAWVTDNIKQYLTSQHVSFMPGLALIESAGGVFSPVTPTTTNLELAQALAPHAILLVAPNRLGVLHDVTATLLAMQHRGCRPDFVVLNDATRGDDSSASNFELLCRLQPKYSVVRFGHANPESAAQLLASIRNLSQSSDGARRERQ